MKEIRPLGKYSPWAWGLEPVRGCNLRCWHCPAQYLTGMEFMSLDTWVATWELIREVSPFCRVEMAHIGEPTLHPEILEFIKIARRISPNSQIQLTTNGTTLMQKKITYAELFNAGLNVVYVDMYAPKEKHVELADQSGYTYFKYYEAPKDAISAWTFHNNPDLRLIALAETPDNWPVKKINRGGLGTFLNRIDFDSRQAKERNVQPVIQAPERRCSQLMKYVQVSYTGTYYFCCMDVFNTAGITQNVKEGKNGFYEFWFGDYMQESRKTLRQKKRQAHPVCSKCAIIYSRCDMLFWQDEMLEVRWRNGELK